MAPVIFPSTRGMRDDQRTRWAPDTCGCAINYYNEPPGSTNDPEMHSTEFVCAKHAAHQDKATHLGVLLGHNRKKNDVNLNLLNNAASLGITLTNDQGLPFAISYDPNAPIGSDPVIVQVPIALNVPANKITQWQTFLNNKYGPGAVTIVVV